MRLGIDFGTTRTVVALCDGGNQPLVQFEDVQGDLHDGFPSVVAANSTEVCFGWQALERQGQSGWSVLPSFKRLLGGGSLENITIGERTFGLYSLVELYFQALMDAIRTQSALPKHLQQDPTVEAIVATPAHADSVQRFLTLEAAKSAGFTIVGMMNEPAAAGVEYASRYHKTFNSKRERVLVYDMGGGTFDASVVDMSGDRHEVIASVGLPNLGGDDFDAALMELVLEDLGLEAEQLSDASRIAMQLHCKEQKESVHNNTKRIIVEVGELLNAQERSAFNVEADQAVIIKISDFYARCEPLVAQSIAIMQPLVDENVDTFAGVYVVGGGSALPLIGRTLKASFGRRVRRALNPTAATAVGLAQAFSAERSFSVFDQLSRSFGVFREARGGESVAFDILFDAKQRLPAEGELHSMTRRYRPVHNIGRFRYVECNGLDLTGSPAGDVLPIDDVLFPFDASLRGVDTLEEVAIETLSSNRPLIEERYTIDHVGIIRFEITDVESGFSLRHRLGSVPNATALR